MSDDKGTKSAPKRVQSDEEPNSRVTDFAELIQEYRRSSIDGSSQTTISTILEEALISEYVPFIKFAVQLASNEEKVEISPEVLYAFVSGLDDNSRQLTDVVSYQDTIQAQNAFYNVTIGLINRQRALIEMLINAIRTR
jgi:hypothetical protein